MANSFFIMFIRARRREDFRESKTITSLLDSVEEVMRESNYSSYKKCRELVSLVVSETGTETIASILGIKESTVRVTKRNLSVSLYELFGSDFFTLLDSGGKSDLVEASRRVSMAKSTKRSSSDYINADCRSLIRGKGHSSSSEFNIVECKAEVSFLISQSKQTIERGIDQLDIEKLGYLLDVLDGSRGSTSDRYNFMNAMDKLIGK